MTVYAAGKRALGECDRCGQTYRLSELRKETVAKHLSSLKVCPTCYDPDHPLLDVPHVKADAQALHEPRPDKDLDSVRNIRWGWKPVYALEAVGSVGVVRVTT